MNDFARHLDHGQARIVDELHAMADRVEATRRDLCAVEASMRRDAEGAARRTRRYAGRHPWQLAGAGVALGAVIALLLQRGRAQD